MPLRDHYRPPTSRAMSWQELHGQWPAVLVQHLRRLLPPGYSAGPNVHPGAPVEIDVAAFEKDGAPPAFGDGDGGGGVATATWSPPAPSLVLEADVPGDEDEYEVRVYDADRERRLVAAIELVSPANKDRPDKRNAFVGKCAALVRAGVAVSIVDVVTARPVNLYAVLLDFLGHPGAAAGDEPLYAASCRWVPRGGRAVLETWAYALAVGEPLPTLPLWLTPTRSVPLELEASYEAACADLAVVGPAGSG